MPANDTDLENVFTALEYTKVREDDDQYVQQCATDEFTLFLFKDQNANSTDAIKPYWKGKTDLAPSTSTVYLQIYNRDITTWETIDSDDATGADTEFILQATVDTNLTDYYDGSNWIACRIYQEA